MKKRMVGLIMLGIAVFLGCSQGEATTKSQEEAMESKEEVETSDTKDNENSENEGAGILMNKNVTIYQNAEWSESQGTTAFAESLNVRWEEAETGIYMAALNDINRIYYWDEATKVCVPLCDKIDCEHVDDSCNAWFAFIDSLTLEYKDDMLYCVGDNGNNMVLYQMQKNGTQQIDVGNLTDETSVVRISPECMELDGEYCYVSGRGGYDENGVAKYKIGRMKIGESESRELIYEYEGEEWSESSLSLGKIEQGYLYFTEARYRQKGEELQSCTALYRYDVELGKVECVLEVEGAELISYVVDGDKLYYSAYTTVIGEEDFITNVHQPVYALNLSTGESTVFIENGGRITYDGQFFYVGVCYESPENTMLDIYDKEGTLLQSVSPCSLTGDIYWETTEGYIIFEEAMFDQDGWNVEIISKSQIGKQEIEYSKICFENHFDAS